MPSEQKIIEHVTHLLDSEQFVTSRSVTKLLTFCVNAALAGEEESLKETTIGVFCFGRSPGYDTKLDPIVRVTARRLRAKLDLFYANEGENHGIHIVLPKGTYVPRFHSRSNQAVATEPPSEEKSTSLEPLSIVDMALIPGQNVPAEAPLPFIKESSWFRPATLGFLIFLLMSSGALVLSYDRIHEGIQAIGPLEGLSLTPNHSDTSSGTSNTGEQLPMSRQALEETPSLTTPKAVTTHGSPESVAIFAEPRL